MRSSEVIDKALVPIGYEQIADLSSVSTLTIPENARIAFMQAEVADVRWRDDGTNPTASVGMLITTDIGLWYTGDLSTLALLESSGGAKLNISYYR